MRNSTKRRNPLGKVIATIFISIILTGVFGYFWYQDQVYVGITGVEGSERIEVTDGDTLWSIADELTAKSLLKSSFALRIYLNLNKEDVVLQTGVYDIPTGLTIPKLLETLVAGPQLSSVQVLVKEGIRYDEVADELEEAFTTLETFSFTRSEYISIVENPDSYTFSASVQEFLNANKPSGKNLEGFLFPDTYVLGADATALDVIDLQIQTLITRLSENGISGGSDRLASFYETLTLASIVEREANAPSDKAIVADIFLSRLENNWPLGSDVTLLYPLKDWTHVLTNDQLQDSNEPYNTRVHLGLTPTPICNPGIAAIKAVITPTINDYYYFIAGNDGVMYYAKTLSEHNRNISLYL